MSRLPAPLSIRNLSSSHIVFTALERHPAPKSSWFAKVGRLLTGMLLSMGLTSAPQSLPLPAHVQPSDRELDDIQIPPFALVATDKAVDPGDGVTRLLFTIEKHDYRLDLPARHPHTNLLEPMVTGIHSRFAIVYSSETSLLAIHAFADPQKWMSDLPDHLSLASLSIPGTHNSPTCYSALPSVRCQAVSPRCQLDNAIRFLDVRVRPECPTLPKQDGLILVHGAFPISLFGRKYFRALVNQVKSFLEEHPRETVIMSVKREGSGKATDHQLTRILRDHYLNDTVWFTQDHVPCLGEARGKIVLMRRFALDDETSKTLAVSGLGINADGWSYNTTFDDRGRVAVQDLCEMLSAKAVVAKLGACCNQLARTSSLACPVLASETGQDPLYLNFSSASNFWKMSCWPEKVAQRLNPAILRQLCERHAVDQSDAGWTTGVVVCDWAGRNGDWDLVRCIVGMNAKMIWQSRLPTDANT